MTRGRPRGPRRGWRRTLRRADPRGALRPARWRRALRRAHRRPERVAARAAVLAVLLASAAFAVLPLYWLFSTAFAAPGGPSFPPRLVPSAVGVENFRVLAAETAFVGTYLVNSVVVSTATVVLTVAIATPAGYALSRFAIPHKSAVMVALLVVQLMPILAMILPLYRMFALAGLLDTLAVIVLTDTVLVVPIATWLIKGYFDTVPAHLEEAAYVGGATRLRAFRVMVPLARPAIGAAALFAFIQSWNQFVIPLTFTSSSGVWTFPVGLYEFISRRGVVDWGLLGAASLVAMVPVLVLFVVFQRQFVAGLIRTTPGEGP